MHTRLQLISPRKKVLSLFDWKGISKSKFVQGLPKSFRSGSGKRGCATARSSRCHPWARDQLLHNRTSSGIEPISHSYKRRVKQHDGETFREYKVYHPLVKEVFGGDEDLPDYVRTAHQIDPYFRVGMQGVIQKQPTAAYLPPLTCPKI